MQIFVSLYTINNYFWGDSKNIITKFTENSSPENRCMLALKSPMKAGKIEALKKLIELLPGGIFLLGYRNSLLKQTAKRIPAIYHHSKLANRSQMLALNESVSMCVDSLLKIPVDAVNGKVLVFDEALLVIEHLLTSETCKGKRHSLLERLKELFGSCAGVVLMSDQLKDNEIKIIQLLSGIETENIIATVNTYKMPQRTVCSYSDDKEWKQSLHDAIKAGKKIFIQSDSQGLTDKWTLKIKQEINPNLRILTINSGTLYKKEVTDFLSSPNELLKLYDVVICSPTAESGLSIDVRGYFDAIYLHWQHLGLDACTQMMHRYRDEKCPVHLYGYRAKDISVTEEDVITEADNAMVQMKLDYLSTRFENITIARHKDLKIEAWVILFSKYQKDDPYTQYLHNLKKKRLWEGHNFRDLLIHDLKERGYSVIEVGAGEVNKEEISTYSQSEEIKDCRTNDILNAKDLTD
ncbi:MAG: plasmid replication protein, CyRepA1 family [Microcoleaceae cyanobacterium]